MLKVRPYKHNLLVALLRLGLKTTRVPNMQQSPSPFVEV